MMNKKDAFSILEIQAGTITPDDIKKAYRRAAMKYHPDRNPMGLEMMKAVNEAFETLKDYEGTVEETHEQNYGEALSAALNAILDLGLTIEICGSWVWVSGDTRTHKEVLKSSGYKWAPKKCSWYFRPEEYKSFNRTPWSMDKIRAEYNSQSVRGIRGKKQDRLAA